MTFARDARRANLIFRNGGDLRRAFSNANRTDRTESKVIGSLSKGFPDGGETYVTGNAKIER